MSSQKISMAFRWGNFLSKFNGVGKSVRRSLWQTDRCADVLPEVRVPRMERAPRCVLAGKVRGVFALSERLSPPALIETLNDSLHLCLCRVQEFGGVFEFHSGHEFNAVFGTSEAALFCALQIRQDLARFNQSRLVDGLSEVTLGMGLHAGSMVLAMTGPVGLRRDSAVGCIYAVARALEEAAEKAGLDLLASQMLADAFEKKICTVRVGELRHEESHSLIETYWIEGYFEDSGKLVSIVTPESRRAGAAVVGADVRRWLINNGSQIVGPWTEQQIARSLFAQEIDFDAECWTEGTGVSSRISQAGIFLGASEADSDYWIYDFKTIHGPFGKPFLLSAWNRGALAQESYICHKSTVAGWLKIQEWIESLSAQGEEGKQDEKAEQQRTKVA